MHMTTSRDYGAELDALKAQMDDLQQLVKRWHDRPPATSVHIATGGTDKSVHAAAESGDNAARAAVGEIFYSGQYRGERQNYRWEPQERQVGQLLNVDGDKVAKVLGALAHKQRLDILRSVVQEPLTGPELVERLNMGTTGQLYHHIKALQGADLLIQEERGGAYSVPGHRALPLLLLLAAASDLLDTSDYIDMAAARSNAGTYLGGTAEYDPHLLLWAVIDNCILEHRAGYCSQVNIFTHDDGSVTVADNGRGIPADALPNSSKPKAQAVLTDMMGRLSTGSSYVAPGGEKGISIAVVNALSQQLAVQICRDGNVYRQQFRHGIPQTKLAIVGMTQQTGTSVTFLPDSDIFHASFDPAVLAQHVEAIAAAYPGLTIRVRQG
jgi:DNA gyrase subunit B